MASADSGYSYITEWGSHGADTDKFLSPQHLTTDPNGNVYVYDLGSNGFKKFNSDGEYLLAWTSSNIFHISGIVADDEYLYVTDERLNNVQKFTHDGLFISKWGTVGSSDGKFIQPKGIAQDLDKNIYVIDSGNNRIQVFTSNGTFIRSFGQDTFETKIFVSLNDIAVDSSNNVYVTDARNSAIYVFNSLGNYVNEFGPNAGGRHMAPLGMAVDDSDNIYVVDPSNQRVILFDFTGLLVASFGILGTADGQFNYPNDITVSSDYSIYVSDLNLKRIQKFTSPLRAYFLEQSALTVSDVTLSTDTPQSASNARSESSVLTSISDDFTAPIIYPPNDLVIEATGILTTLSIGEAVAIDESGIAILQNNAPENFSLGLTNVIWTAVDGSGNTGFAIQQINVTDTIPPIIRIDNDVTVESISFDQNLITLKTPQIFDAVGVVSVTNDAPSVYSLGTTHVTWTAIDLAGNIATATQTIHVIDTQSAKIESLYDIMIDATSNETSIPLSPPDVIDNGMISSITNDAPSVYPIGNTTITWYVTDTFNNTATAQQIINVVDNTPPEFPILSNIEFEATSAHENKPIIILPNVSDIQDIILVHNGTDVYSIGTHTIQWIATDSSGNNANSIQFIIIHDTTAPEMTTPVNITMEAVDLLTPVSLDDVTVHDVSRISNLSNDSPELFELGTTLVTWIAVDEFGNSASSVQFVTIVDTTPPTIHSVEDLTVEATNLEGTLVQFSNPAVFDTIEIHTITNNAPILFPLGLSTITWFVNDTSGNFITEDQSILVVDTTAPNITTPIDLVHEINNSSGMIISIGDAVVSDQINIASVTNDAPEIFRLGNTIITWSVNDTFGNVATATQTVTIQDTTAPILTLPFDITQEAESINQTAVSLGTADATDLVGVDQITNDAPDFFPLGLTTITWTATDASGNVATATQTVTIQDTTAPTLTLPFDITQEAESINQTAVSIGTADATDLVGVDQITNDAPDFFPFGLTTITWTATDASGNVATATQTVTIQDTTPPKLTIPRSVNAEALDLRTNFIDYGSVSASDFFDIHSITNDAPDSFPLGLTTITWTATDASGNVATATQTVTIQDTTAPTLTLPFDITQEAESINQTAVSIGTADATDLVGVDQITNDAPDSFPLGLTTITWTATDASGNVATATQTVIIQDTTAPTLTLPFDITQEAESINQTAVSIGTADATDLVGVDQITNDAPDFFPLGLTTITWTSTDASGNVATAIQTVTIQDTTAPTLTLPFDITQEAESINQTAVSIGTADATDLVGVDQITNDAPDFFPLGLTTITWTSTDASGNVATAIQTVTIQDTTAPTLTLPFDITQEAESINQTAVSIGTADATDLVGVDQITNDAPDFFPLGLTTITWTATDASGNVATATQTVIIQDTTAPTLTLPFDITQEAESINQTAVSIGTADATDLVGVDQITNDAPDSFPLGLTTITWTSTDASGNVATAIQTVTIQDTTAPTLTLPFDITQEAESINQTAVSIGTADATDLVGVDQITNDAPDSFPLGLTTIAWTATDASGNVATATQTVTIQDTTAPVMILPEDITISATNIVSKINIGNVSISDLTDSAPIVQNNSTGIFLFGQTSISWYSVDKFGNDVTSIQNINVQTCGRQVSDFNLIQGTDNDDILIGTSSDDLIVGFGGNDIINGGAGNDCIFGGSGDDIILGNSGDDWIIPGIGDNTIHAQSGNDIIYYDIGLNLINGGLGLDSCIPIHSTTNTLLTNCE